MGVMADLGDLLDAELIQKAGSLWEEATTSPFLEAVATGDVSPVVFGRWLSQDYLFATELTAFQAVVVSKVPRACHKPLIQGLVALDAELAWFESHARRLQLELSVSAHPGCRRYTDFLLHSAHTERYPLLLAILFGVEASYLAAWSALAGEGPYTEFIERWSSEAFKDYVLSLRRLAENNSDPAQQEAFNRVLEFEHDFWTMAWEG